MIKLIMSDMDGTLLDENGCLPKEFGDVLRQLRERHVVFAPASGRQYFALRHQFEPWADELLFFAENGTFVNYHDVELFSSPMESGVVRQVLTAACEIPGVYPVVCGKRGAYVTSRNDAFFAEMEKYYTHYEMVQDFADVQDEVIKISLCDARNADAEHTIYPVMRPFDGRLQVAVSGGYWVDIMNFGINKGIAIQQVQKLLGIAPKECAAFGDYLNDLEMMSSVYYSYAMENAHPKIKEVANFLAPSNKEHGVMRMIQAMIDKKMM